MLESKQTINCRSNSIGGGEGVVNVWQEGTQHVKVIGRGTKEAER